MPEFFSAPWAAAAAEQLNASAAYREAAATWEGAVRLVAREVPDGPSERAVWLDLHRGTCRETRAGAAALEADAPFEILGLYPVWLEVLEGRLDPLVGLMLKKLTLTGDLAQVGRHVRAAKEMVACAAAVETTFPETAETAEPA